MSLFVKNRYQRLEKVIPTEVTIVAISNFSYSTIKEEIILYEGRENLDTISISAVSLPKPILITPGFMYEIRMKQNPPEKCASKLLLKSQIEVDSGITVQFHRDPYLEGDKLVARGLIWNLRFFRI